MPLAERYSLRNGHRQRPRQAQCRFNDPPNDDLVSGPVHPAAEESSNVKYLCLVYEEAKADAVSAHESVTLTDEDLEYLADLQVSGHSLASARLQPAETAATVRVRNGSVFISDALGVGGEGAIGWVSPHRRQGPERRHPDRREDAVGTPGMDRGAAAGGMRPWMMGTHPASPVLPTTGPHPPPSAPTTMA